MSDGENVDAVSEAEVAAKMESDDSDVDEAACVHCEQVFGSQDEDCCFFYWCFVFGSWDGYLISLGLGPWVLGLESS